MILGLLFGAPVAILVGGIAAYVRASFGLEFGSYAALGWGVSSGLIVWGLATIVGGAWAVEKWSKENEPARSTRRPRWREHGQNRT